MKTSIFTNILAGVALSTLLMGCESEITEKLPNIPTDKPMPVALSRITVGASINLATLRQQADAAIPNPIVSINESRSGCYKDKIAGIKVSVGCDIWGSITKRSGLNLTGSGGTLSLSIPIHAKVSAKTHKIKIQETAEADATVFADASPTLNENWQLSLNLRPDLRWDKRPTVCVIFDAICFTIGSLVEPKVREQLANSVQLADAEIAKLEISKKIEEVWASLAKPIKLSADPDIWLSVAPKKVGFSGVSVQDDILTTNVEVIAGLQSSIGSQPAPTPVEALPNLQSLDGEPSTFDISLPVELGYEKLIEEASKALKKGTIWSPDPANPEYKLNVSNVEVYPSNGRVAIGITAAVDTPESFFDTKGTVYLAATPEIDNANSVLRLSNLALTSNTDNIASNALLKLLSSKPVLAVLESQAVVPFGAKYDELLAKASVEMTRDLGNGFRSEGSLQKMEVGEVVPGSKGIRLNLRATGNLKVLFGL